MKYILAGLGIVGIFLAYMVFDQQAKAANSIQYAPDLYPSVDSRYYLGTTTKAWLQLVTDGICLNGSCRTSWPTGGGSASTTITVGGVDNDGPFIFATGTPSTGLFLSLTSDGAGTITWNPQLTSGYNIPLTASTTNWNNLYTNVLSRLVVATGTTGNIFNISTSTNSLTLNLPIASAANTGQLSSTDWTTFNNKLGSYNVVSANGLITVSTTTALATLTASTSPTFTNLTATNASTTNFTSSGTAYFGSVQGISLNEIEDLTADKTFTMNANNLTFSFTTPSDGLTLNATGAFSDHVMHIHQSTGNPGAGAELLHLAADDNDVLPFSIQHTGSPTMLAFFEGRGDISIGSSTPYGKLTVQGTSTEPTLDLLRIASSTGQTLLRVQANGSTTITSLSAGVVQSTATGGLYIAPVSLTTQVSGVLPIANGGTATTSSPTVIGQLLGAHGSGSWGVVNLVAGSNITLTTSTLGQITIAATGGSGNSAWTIGPSLIYNATSTDSVLIGTSTPTTATVILQGVGTKLPFVIASSTGSTLFSVGQNASVTIASLTAASCDVKSTTGGQLYCGIDATGASLGNAAWTIGSGLIYNATSTDLVGIGTITPSTTLFVQGKAGTNPFQIASSTGNPMLSVYQSGNLVIATSTIPSTNNGPFTSSIGFGNFISACESCGSTSGNLLAVANYGTGSVGINTFQARGSVASPSASQSGDIIYFMGGRGFGSTVWNGGSKAAIQFVANQNFTDSANGTYITLETTPDSSTTRAERVRITDAGNVGIGTTTPNAKLQVTGTAGSNNIVNFASSTNVSQFLIGPNGSTTIANLNAASCDVKSTTGGQLYCGTDATGASTGNAAWTIGTGLIYNATSTDSVLVGTSTPTTATLFLQGSGVKLPFRVASSTGAILATIDTFGNFNYATATASTIAGFDANKNLTSLTTTSVRTTLNLNTTTLATINFVGNGSAITNGSTSTPTRIPFSSTITGYSISANASCSGAIDIWKAAGAVPTAANRITASAMPTLSSSQLTTSYTLTGWTTAINNGDVIIGQASSSPTCINMTLVIEGIR
jgi:hypothetical protein